MLTRSYMGSNASKNLLAYTPMLHARMFVETTKYRNHHFQPLREGDLKTSSAPSETAQGLYLDGHPTLDRPLIVQFCANDADNLLKAAQCVQPYCDAVDLNLGCPQGIARKGNYGAFLQEDWNLIHRLISNLRDHLDVPVTAKMRILETKEKTLEYAKVLLAAGASIITVHGRQRDQKGHRTGLADWSVIRYLRDNLPPQTVMFANGNILRHEDLSRCLEVTGADGVMSAEGNLYDPTIFAEAPALGDEGREYWRGKDGKGGFRMDAVFRRYIDILYQYVLERPSPERPPLFLPSEAIKDSKEAEVLSEEAALVDTDQQPPAKKQKRGEKFVKATSPNLISMQAHLFHLLRSLVSKHTNVRDALARCRAGDMAAFENVLSLVELAVREGLLDYQLHPENYDGEAFDTARPTGIEVDLIDHENSLAAVKACKRPWWICQSHVRPLPKEALEKGSLTMGKKAKQRMEEEAERLEKSKGQTNGTSDREKLDKSDGMEPAEMPKEAMVCG